jgi:hypothetical protein
MAEIKTSCINSKKIIEIAHKYLVGAPTERIPERIQTLGDIELETKINIQKLTDIEIVLNKIQTSGFSKVAHRTELHHFFSNNHIAHNVLILIKDSNEIWIKIKKDKKQVYTVHDNLPILLRHEKKIKPQDMNYRDEFQLTITQNYIGSFKKECLDYSFYYKDLSFTCTLSLADAKNSSLYQIEFEFDGHKENSQPPDFDKILVTFEQMLLDICQAMTNRLTLHTKLEWLLSINN